MTAGHVTIIGALLAAAGLSVVARTLQARDAAHALSPPTERLLYLRSGRVADRLFLAFDAVAADIYWIRTIQHYGRDRKSSQPDRFQLLQPLLDVTTTLDPRFNIAYRFGAMFLSMEPPNGPGRSDHAIALLRKGLARNPGRWQYAHDIGFVHYWHTGDFPAAAEWFAIAAGMPGAPAWIAPVAAITRARGGDRAGARQMLEEMRTADEPYIRAAAERSIAQIRALDDIDHLQLLVDRSYAATGRLPAGWDDLIQAGTLAAAPVDPTGTPYVYESRTRTVTLAPASALAPLPPIFRGR